jgi:hypothetical protein
MSFQQVIIAAVPISSPCNGANALSVGGRQVNALIGILIFVALFTAGHCIVRFVDGKPTDWLLLSWSALCFCAAVIVWKVSRKFWRDDQ